MNRLNPTRLSQDDLARIGHDGRNATTELEQIGLDAVMTDMFRRGLDPELTVERGYPTAGVGQPEPRSGTTVGDPYVNLKVRVKELFTLVGRNGHTASRMPDGTTLEYNAKDPMGQKNIINQGRRNNVYIDLLPNDTGLTISFSDSQDIHELQLRTGKAPSYTHDPSKPGNDFPTAAFMAWLDKATGAAMQ